MLRRQGLLLAIGFLLSTPLPLTAQSSGAIAGVARDSSGAVLPGVTVEAASPALIEKVRSAATDGQGQYNITELRPGTYTVTFTLPGFRTVVREGIQLTTGFTATVNAEMSVGGLEETITVSGESPVVDTRNSRTQEVFDEKLLATLPVPQTEAAFASITPGLSTGAAQDLGGSRGERGAGYEIHGSVSIDSQSMVDGMHIKGHSGTSNAGTKWYKINRLAIQETTLSTGAATAETESGGVYLNYVPKDGGNRFSLIGLVEYSNDSMQSDNIDANLISRGIGTPATVSKIYDYGGGFGGPIKRDKLWFYTAHRAWGSTEVIPATWQNLHLGEPRFEADLSKPGSSDLTQQDHDVRLTWNATQKQRVNFTFAYQNNCWCQFLLGGFGGHSLEATTDLVYSPLYMTQGKWTYVLGRVLVDAGMTGMYNTKLAELQPGVTKDTISIRDSGYGVVYNAPNVGLNALSASADGMRGDQINAQAAVQYVTGSHALKVGTSFYLGFDHRDAFVTGGGVTYDFRLGTPVSLTQWATPQFMDNRVLMSAIYAQDQLTIRRLTLNLGVRYDRFGGWAAPVDVPAGPFLPARSYDRVDNKPLWNDVSPRLGFTYDLFGNGRTAVKAFVGRYVQSQGIGIVEAFSPANLVVQSTTRQWTDDGDLVPECVLTNFAANGECGAINNNLFGSVRSAITYDPDYLEGWHRRPYTWQGQVALQHELRPGVAVNAGWYRTSYGNATVTDNRAVSPADYDPYCVTIPTDARLPGGGGNQLCGLYDLKPSAFGKVDPFVTLASNFGKQTLVHNSVDVSINARFQGGAFVIGSVSMGKRVEDACFVVDSPQGDPAPIAFRAANGFGPTLPGNLFCHVSAPWAAGTLLKGTVVYPLPWGIQTSVVAQNLPGAVNEATRTYTNAEIAPNLGRNLSGCPAPTGPCSATRSIPLHVLNSEYESRLNRVDFRLSKFIDVGKARIQANLDVYNLFNDNTVLSATSAYGPNWLRPSGILGGRLVKVGGQVSF